MKQLTRKQLSRIMDTGAFTKAGDYHRGMYVDSYLSDLFAGRKIRTLRQNGTGRNTRYQNIVGAYVAIDVAHICGYNVITGNDAPRGGAMGDYDKLTRKVSATTDDLQKQVKEYLNAVS